VKRGKLIYSLSQIVITLTIITISGCEKSNTNDYKKFLGTWISTDLVDTLDFTSDHDFYKTFACLNDHFNYWSSRDCIIVQYDGFLKILIAPTTHFYQLKGNELTIDFTKGCYGFREQEIKFMRK
jgi:hypothetical protein